MSYSVVLYYNSSNPNKINKSITQIASYDCNFKDDIDVENPVIYLSAGASVDKCNYMYIAEFGRYYYAHAITKRGNAIEISGQSDPLMSFKTAILSSPAVIARNPWHYDLYVPDPKLPIEARTVSNILKFTGDHFKGSNNSYILTTLGSG